jgi:dynein heavy chain, axonemal
MLFETHDLSKASPATISRCGMVYLAQDAFGGSDTLLTSWLYLFRETV